MKMRRALGLFLFLGAVAWATGCTGKTDEAGKPEGAKAVDATKALQIAVIPKGTSHEFWKTIHAGALQAAKELPNVSIDWQGPTSEGDRRAQIEYVETFIQKHVDGIVLAPLDLKALVDPVREARKARVPVVIIDSDLADPDAYVSFIATDNYKGGQLGAKRLAEVLGDKGKVVLLRYAVGSASTENREKGFLDEIAKHPQIEVVSSDQYAGAEPQSAMSVAQGIVTKYGEGKVNGIFCPNESSAFGMLQALRTANRAGKIKFVGFDVNKDLLEALKKGEMQGLVLQDPFKMGYLGVKTCVAYIRGEKVEKNIDTGVKVATMENMSDPEIDKLLHPPLAE
jgi:ribose transport system substrate-binding protein